MSNDFWTFSLAVYASEDVAQHCIAAQDELGIDVNVVLYALWQAHNKRALSEEHLHGLQRAIDTWRQDVVIPLRELRRRLRHHPQAQALRESVKTLELEAERQQQDQMWAFYLAHNDLADGETSVIHNLDLLVTPAARQSHVWRALLDVLGRLPTSS